MDSDRVSNSLAGVLESDGDKWEDDDEIYAEFDPNKCIAGKRSKVKFT